MVADVRCLRSLYTRTRKLASFFRNLISCRGGQLDLPDLSRPGSPARRPSPRDTPARHRSQHEHHRTQRLWHHHGPGRGRLGGQREERPPQPLPRPVTPPTARTGRAGTHRWRDPGPADRHRRARGLTRCQRAGLPGGGVGGGAGRSGGAVAVFDVLALDRERRTAPAPRSGTCQYAGHARRLSPGSRSPRNVARAAGQDGCR